MKFYTTLKTSTVGSLLLVADETHLLGIYFSDREHAKIGRDWVCDPKKPILRRAGAELQEYLNGQRKEFSVPLHFAGTDFQRAIWRQIALVPFGKTISYTDLAQRAGTPRALRAAGTATGKNPIGIIIPCHRIVGKNGGLGGYAGGLDRKKSLLQIEGIAY